jgi:hypothetical protein
MYIKRSGSGAVLGVFLCHILRIVPWRACSTSPETSNGTFYRHRKELLHYGIDIGETINVDRIPVKTKVITLQPCTSKPDFYQMPDVALWSDPSNLSLVKTA